jgi:hypothetical protein
VAGFRAGDLLREIYFEMGDARSMSSFGTVIDMHQHRADAGA